MTALADDGTWKLCNICKTPIPFRAEYFVCSVSTCNRKRTGLFFCSLPCFEAHLPTARHRDAWAQREKAPTAGEWQAAQAAEAADDGGSAGGAGPQPAPGVASAAREAEPAEQGRGEANETEILVVVSKLKKYVRDWSGMNTSDGAMGVLSDHLRELCREATRRAGMDGRRTVLTKVLAERREGARRTDFDSRR